VMPEKTRETARMVIGKVVAALMERLERRTADAIRGALDRSKRTNRPRFADIDWPRTIHANLRHYQAEHRTVVPERLIGFKRHQRRIVDLDEVVLCVDQSGSMATSVVYASIFAAVMASLPVVATKLVCFDTAVVDLTGVSFIASLGIRMLLGTARALDRYGAKLALYGANDEVMEIIETTALTEIIPVVGTEDEAVAAVTA